MRLPVLRPNTSAKRKHDVQAIAAAHERMVAAVLAAVTPSQRDLLDEIQRTLLYSKKNLACGPSAVAVAAQQLRVAVGVVGAALMASEFQDASCYRHAPACFGCMH